MATPFALALDPPLVEDDDEVFPPANAKLPPVATEKLLEDDEPASALPPANIERAAARTIIFFTEISL